MEYANTFCAETSLWILWRPFAQDRPPRIRCSSGYLIYLQGTEADLLLLFETGKGKELHPARRTGRSAP